MAGLLHDGKRIGNLFTPYKDACLDGSGYVHCKAWAKHQPQFQDLSQPAQKQFDQEAN